MPNPKTASDYRHNTQVLKEINRDHEDDIFVDKVCSIIAPIFELLQSWKIKFKGGSMGMNRPLSEKIDAAMRIKFKSCVLCSQLTLDDVLIRYLCKILKYQGRGIGVTVLAFYSNDPSLNTA